MVMKYTEPKYVLDHKLIAFKKNYSTLNLSIALFSVYIIFLSDKQFSDTTAYKQYLHR